MKKLILLAFLLFPFTTNGNSTETDIQSSISKILLMDGVNLIRNDLDHLVRVKVEHVGVVFGCFKMHMTQPELRLFKVQKELFIRSDAFLLKCNKSGRFIVLEDFI